MTQGFRGWRVRAQERGAHVAAMRNAVKKLLLRDLSRGWTGWSAHTRIVRAKLEKQRQVPLALSSLISLIMTIAIHTTAILT